jgi:hypothetical protein
MYFTVPLSYDTYLPAWCADRGTNTMGTEVCSQIIPRSAAIDKLGAGAKKKARGKEERMNQMRLRREPVR